MKGILFAVMGASRLQRHRRHGARALVVLALLNLLAGCQIDRSDAGDVATAFVEALAEGDSKAAKTLAAEDQWDQIDSWVNGHPLPRCRGLNWDTGPRGAGGHDSAKNVWHYGVEFVCADEQTPFCVSVDTIVLEWVDREWQVVEWGQACVDTDFCLTCPR